MPEMGGNRGAAHQVGAAGEVPDQRLPHFPGLRRTHLLQMCRQIDGHRLSTRGQVAGQCRSSRRHASHARRVEERIGG